MPPKRKASSSDLSKSPNKRPTYSIRHDLPQTPGRVTRSSGKLVGTPSTPIRTPQATKTYGKNTSTRRMAPEAESLKENEELGQASSRNKVQSEMSDDELDVLSPSKTLTERLDKQARPASSTEVITSITIGTRSKKQPETPIHRPAKRVRTVSTPRSESPKLEDEIILPGLNRRSKRHAATVSQVQRRTSPIKSQVTSPSRTSSRKTPSVANRLRGSRRGSIHQTRDLKKHTMSGTQDDSSSPSKTLNTTGDSSFDSSQALIECSPDPDASQFTPPTVSLIFDGVVLPSVSTPVKPKKATPTGSAPDSLSDEPSNIRPLYLPQAVDLRTTSPPEPERSKLTPIPTPPLKLKRKATIIPSLPAHIPNILPSHLHTCLIAQKRAILQALQQPPEVVDSASDDENEDPSTNKVASKQLTDLLSGTINRGEGNSCLILGPRGSGKSRLVEQCISSFSEHNPLVIRLSGCTQHSDRLAMREIAHQLGEQTGNSFLEKGTDVSEDVQVNDVEDNSLLVSQSLASAARLPSLVSLLPTFNRPAVVILEGFDLFVLHPRQALLYCLLDTAQSCRVTIGNKGLAVIGVTSRNDTIVHLEKRVKSRFSGRIIRTAPPRTLQVWQSITKAILTCKNEELLTDPALEDNSATEWHSIWTAVVEKCLNDNAVQNVWNDTFGITRDVRMLTRIMFSVVLRLSPSSFSLSASQFTSAADVQRVRPQFPFLHTLPYPSICLLIASVHADTTGQQAFTFEMLYETFRDQVRASTSAPVQLRGGSIGMVRCSRQVLMIAFENLVAMRAFVPVVAYAQSVAKEFVKYRSVVEREDVRKAVEKMSQVNLKKWLTKATQ